MASNYQLSHLRSGRIRTQISEVGGESVTTLLPWPLHVMHCFHWNRQAGNYAFLESRDHCLHGRFGDGCKLPACRGESVKYQTCLIFPRPLLTLVSNPNFSPLTTGLSVNFTACRLHFPACRLIKQACL